ncbi:MAG TPA: SRPBCC family protein [Gemmatimonadales bacterium]|jgi:uncharacterized protein YndB with AHSA1/START domain|nr:SRPBCC family protein [Gemmatimonadales bacterium]
MTNWTRRRKRKALRRRIGVTLVSLAAVLGGITAVGGLLPAECQREGRRLLQWPPETVWRVLVDLDGMPAWRSDLTALERLPDLGGRPAWRELGRGAPRVMRLILAQAPRRLVIQGAEPGRAALRTRTVELLPTGKGTLVTLTDRDEVRSPIARVLRRLGAGSGELDRFLGDLDHRAAAVNHQSAAAPGL